MQNANMQTAHLDLERLASLDHDALTTDELAHLAGCAACRAERLAQQSLAKMAASVRMPNEQQSPRLTQWETLSAQLRAEGLITSPVEAPTSDDVPLVVRAVHATPPLSASESPTVFERKPMPTWLRAAAAIVLVLGGAFAGRLTIDTTPSTATATVASEGSESFGSVQQASEVLYRAQRDYERASLWLASNDTTTHSSDVYRARLAALDQMMASSRAALRDAPSDPILNHYFQTASTAREATLRQLSSALPLDKTLERY